MTGADEQLRFIESAIRSQRQLQKLQLGLALAVFVLGLACIVVAQWFGAALVPDNLKQLVSLGGGFLATLSSFPFKQLYDRRFKISALELLSARWQRMLAGDLAPDEAADLRLRFDKIWELGLAA
jgi:hypothetical protein